VLVKSEIKAGNWLGPLHGILADNKDFYDGWHFTEAYELTGTICFVVAFIGGLDIFISPV
jgi:hypothetical protein